MTNSDMTDESRENSATVRNSYPTTARNSYTTTVRNSYAATVRNSYTTTGIGTQQQ
jgi:hypothetical protein